LILDFCSVGCSGLVMEVVMVVFVIFEAGS
jgi:hypothetical protein